MINENTRTQVKFQIFEHEDDASLVDFTLELTNFQRKNLADLLTSIRDTFAKPRPATPPDES
ncbi:MAG: hypothetical protein V7K26_03575 [Nostoc sp.]|uniref:hypothetical protein n=1 Tax=Nostoc sp. TaxID=1180 RepID=UPI002FF33A70